MIAASDPNLMVGSFAIGGLGLTVLWKLIVWVRDSPVKPDPWDAEVEQQLLEAAEACPRCSTPQPPDAWFCAHCGKAVGPYNNYMPYVDVFSQGEVLRNGVADRLRTSPVLTIGYLLYSLSCFTFFAPVYWFFLFKNLNSQPQGEPGENALV